MKRVFARFLEFHICGKKLACIRATSQEKFRKYRNQVVVAKGACPSTKNRFKKSENKWFQGKHAKSFIFIEIVSRIWNELVFSEKIWEVILNEFEVF
ncbi:MAG: hypothetical protein AB1626_00900 [Candidatus Micrarchaeota archaeon]